MSDTATTPPELVTLTDAEVDAAPITEIRAAYRALREHHGLAVADALRRLREAGKYAGGGKPYGFEVGPDDETLRAVALEQEAITKARSLRERGLSLRAIARTLEEIGLRSRSGGKFDPKQISRMLRV